MSLNSARKCCFLVVIRTTALCFVVLTHPSAAQEALTPILQLPLPAQVYAFGTNPGDPAWALPSSTMTQGTDGNLYGTTPQGGSDNYGTIFKVTPDGTLTVVHNFLFDNGPFSCYNGVVLANDGNLYGTCYGVADSQGNITPGDIYKITPAGVFTDLHDFSLNGVEGFHCTGIIQGLDGNFYGTTELGATNGSGAFFKMSPSGVVSVLHVFTTAEAAYISAPLIQASDGNFYITSVQGGTNLVGTVLRITPAGSVTVLHNFATTDGAYPSAGLLQAKDGSLYGTTLQGASNNLGGVYRIAPNGVFTLVHSFTQLEADGVYVALTQGTDGYFYGVSEFGGATDQGTVFSMDSSGNLLSWDFGTNPSVFSRPISAIVQHTNGSYFANTEYGGAADFGTIYGFSFAEPAFCRLQPATARVGVKIGILGQGFSTASVVKFGGVRATAISLSGTTFITATVPPGAKTGNVTVTTGSTTLTSNQAFKVKPVISSFSPTSGPVGTVVTITGSGLSQTMIVKFATVKATSFAVNSDTQVTATVPAGAVTGKISVTTPGGSASSATAFTVN